MRINEIQLHVTTWIDFTSTILSKRTHKHYIIHDSIEDKNRLIFTIINVRIFVILSKIERVLIG